MSVVPAELGYTAQHQWLRRGPDGIGRVGITDYAQDALGDVIAVVVPNVGKTVIAHEPCGEIESTKSLSDVFAPVSGVVTSVNPLVVDRPELVNEDPYGAGWLFELVITDDAETVLDATQYKRLTNES